MNLVPDWAPNVHPMFVHFPIGLLFTALAVNLLSLLTGSPDWLRRAAIVLYAAGAVAAGATYLTGDFAAEDIVLPAAAESILTEHETFALWTLIYFGVYAVARIVVEILVRGGRKWLRIVLFLAALPGGFLVWETAEHGSEMVYGHGVGIAVVEEAQEAPEPPVVGSGLEMTAGGWTWRPAAGATLSDSLLWWVEGTPADLELDSAGDTTGGVYLHPKTQPLLVAVRRELANVQVTAEVDPGGGDLMLVHHVQANGDYDFLEIKGDQVSLGRFQSGKANVLESAETDVRGPLRLRAAGDETHLRGYVNDRLLVHAHSHALPPGAAGIRIVQADSLLLKSLTAEPI